MILALSIASLLCSAAPAYFYFRNVGVFRRLPTAGGAPAAVSVLIPARDEEANIAECVGAVLANDGVELEVVVLDDHSTDDTAAIVTRIAAGDPRVRLVNGKELPAGWNGKQHACWQLAQASGNNLLVFLDADVRLSTDGVARVASRMGAGVDLLSGFPRQVTGSLMEHLLAPLIHFVLLGFLSLRHLRREQKPEFAAGCGQLFATTRSAYEASGGHAAIRASRHDGIKLPRRYLSQGLTVDVFDATDLASVRMYRGARATWNGFAKNADEGVATPGLLPPVTAALLLGQVAPFGFLAHGVLTALGFTTDLPLPAALLGSVAALLAILPRLDACRRFRQSWLNLYLHPIAVLLFLAVQWWALLSKLAGRQVAWKGRPAASTP